MAQLLRGRVSLRSGCHWSCFFGKGRFSTDLTIGAMKTSDIMGMMKSLVLVPCSMACMALTVVEVMIIMAKYRNSMYHAVLST